MAKRSKHRKLAPREDSPKAADRGLLGRSQPGWLNSGLFPGLALLIAVMIVYSPVWRAGYVWDDDMFVTTNPVIVGPLGLKEIWTTNAADVCPLTLTLFWLVHPLWGLNPLPYHLMTVLLHGACAILLWKILRYLNVPGAWIGAALWALHPVNVESVAWIAETKNTLSCLFYLGSILLFLKGGKGWVNYAFMLGFAALAMASKSSTVILPLVLCLCAWWQAGRWRWHDAVKFAPIFLFSLCAGLSSIWTQKIQEATVENSIWERSWPERVAAAGDAVWFYVGKLLWPHPQMMIYPRWQINAGEWTAYLPALAVCAVSVFLWLKRDAWGRPLFFAWTYFLVALLPVIGLVTNFFSRYSLVADHFVYLASMGPLALAGAGFAYGIEVAGSTRKWIPLSVASLLVLVFGVMSWDRSRAYENDEILWTDTLAKNPACWVGHNNLGNALAIKGDLDQAIVHYEKALQIYPEYAEGENNLGNAILHQGRADEAIGHYRKALAIDLHYADACYNLGFAFYQQGQMDDALNQFRQTLEINPLYVQAHYNLGNIYLQWKQGEAAVGEFQKALEIQPDDTDARNNLAVTLMHMGRTDEAIAQFEEILRRHPENATVQHNLSKARAMASHPMDSK